MPPELSIKRAEAWELDWFPGDFHPRNTAIENVQKEYVQRRLRKWNDRLSAYWAGLHEVRAALYRDARVLRRAEQDSIDRLERHLLDRNPDGCENLKFRHLMEAQRVARRGREFHGFLHLPPEVRMLIYEHLLVVGDVFVPNSYADRRAGVEPLTKAQLYKPCGKPYYRYRHYSNSVVSKDALRRYTPGLIQGVCKTVQHEAMPVFLARNRFIFSYGSPEYPVGFNGSYLFRGDLDHMQLVRDVSCTFDSRDGRRRPGSDFSGPAMDLRTSRKYTNFLPNLTGAAGERAAAIHEDQEAVMQEFWERRVRRLKEKTRLKRLQIDFEECYCPLGCCRKVEQVCIWLRDNWKLAVPEVIEIVGWWNELERKQILILLIALRDEERECKLEFVGQSIETWDMFNDPDDEP